MPTHYAFAKVADRTLGIEIYHDQMKNKYLAVRYKRGKKADGTFAVVADETPVEVTDDFSFDLEIPTPGDTGVGAIEATGWGDIIYCDDLVVPMGYENAFTGNGQETPVQTNGPTTPVGSPPKSARALTFMFKHPKNTGGPARVNWAMKAMVPEGLSGTVPFRPPGNMNKHGLIIGLRLVDESPARRHRGRLKILANSPWGANPQPDLDSP